MNYEKSQSPPSKPDHVERDVDRLELVLTVLCTLFLAIGFFGSLLGWVNSTWERTLYIGSYVTGGYYGVLESYRYLKKLRFNVDVLMILAAAGAAVIGEWVEGAALLFLFSLSNSLQSFAMGRSRRAIRSLMNLRPNEALVRRDGSEERVAVEELQLGEIVIVKPGERIPIDGSIVRGQTSIDQSAITGESIPVNKKTGDDVFAATMNEHGAIEIKVTHRAEDTTLARIIQLVEQAQARKAATQRFLDQFESRYATGVIGFTVGLILVPWLVMDQAFDPVFYRAMTILVVASPCALIISTPATILSGIANAARNGILFKGGAYLEEAARIEAVAFDKTGTLTLGKPEVTDVLAVEDLAILVDENADQIRKKMIPTGASRHLLRVVAGAEQYSEHHLGQAIVKKARYEEVEIPRAENLQAAAGQGIRAVVDGEEVRVGNLMFFEGSGVSWPEPLLAEARQLEENQGKTVIFAVSGKQPMGIIALADTIRPQAREALQKLRDLGLNQLIMITGDAERVARNVAENLKISEYYAELLPEQKVRYVEDIARNRAVAMVGDGVNDAPALAASQLGVAMGAAGTDVALETADVVLMADDLNKLPYVIELARRARRVVWQNIGFALGVILLLVASVFAFELPLPLGVVGHEGSTLIVVLNGLRLLRS